jgi:endonuclease/exonuclease/phosphatase family metal-dependent hydrolase
MAVAAAVATAQAVAPAAAKGETPRWEAGFSSASDPGPRADPVPKVLLLGWDGIRPDVLREVPTPNFDALAAVGAFSETAEAARPTVSGPCWSSILTGVWPEKHGVLSNNFTTNRYDAYPDFFTLIERVRPELNTFVVADWLPLVAENSGGPLLSDEIDGKVVLNGYDLGWLEADSISVDYAVQELRTGDPDVLFVYAGSPDEISHNIGGLGREYREAISAADRQLGRLMEAIRTRPTYGNEDWLILLTTDHGRTEEGGHGGLTPEETTVYYLASGPSTQSGSLVESPGAVDLAATALAHLGIEIDPAWELDGKVVGLKGSGPVVPFPRTDTLRILAYNTHHGEGLDGALDLERIGHLIEAMNPDLVTLQEIDRIVERTGGVDQAAEYGALTGMDSRFGDFMEYQGGHYGMAVLSRLPILESANHRLPDGAEPRTALTVRVGLPGTGREAVVSGIHFYRTEEERLAQAESLMDALADEDGLVILAGDFNSLPGSPVMDLLDTDCAITEKTGNPFTFPANEPAREIDFILVRPDHGFRVLEYRVLDETVASDHRPIFMVLEF